MSGMSSLIAISGNAKGSEPTQSGSTDITLKGQERTGYGHCTLFVLHTYFYLHMSVR